MKRRRLFRITFQDEEYTDTAVLNITPEPDSILRVFMVYKPLNQQAFSFTSALWALRDIFAP